MAALPYMPFYPADYLADTRHLSTVEHGAYLLLILSYWNSGKPLPDSDARLARLAGLSVDEWEAMRPVLAEFFTVGNGEWRHKRIDSDLEAISNKVDKARAAAQASVAARARTNASTSVQTSVEADVVTIQNQNQNQISPNGEYPPTPQISEEAWQGWIEMRKAMKKPPTERAVQLALKTLAKLAAEGHDPNDVLNQSTMNGWTGLFPVKGNTNDRFDRPSGWIEQPRSGRARA